MNVTLSINTNETGERFKFFCLSQAEEMYYSLSDIRDNLDNISKYSTFLHLFMGKESLLRLYKEEKKQFPFENLSNEQLS